MLGQKCRILMGEFAGIVVGTRSYLGDGRRYAVRYMDFSGPQERWFTGSEISFAAAAEGENVVEFKRAS